MKFLGRYYIYARVYFQKIILPPIFPLLFLQHIDLLILFLTLPGTIIYSYTEVFKIKYSP